MFVVKEMITKPSTDTTDIVRMYLREIGRIPLLTRKKENDYGTQVQQMMSLLEAKETLAKKLRREPTSLELASHVNLSESDLKQTLERGQCAKPKMIEANLRLVVVIAKKYQNRNLEFLDLIQEGTIGLIRAVEKFDPARGWKFSTYATWWISQAITRGIYQKSRTIRLPMNIIEELNKIKKVQRQLSQQLERTPTTAEVANFLGLTPLQVQEYLERARLPLSLEMRVGDNQDTELGELLESSGTDPEEFVMQSNLSTDLERLMAELTPQQREVLQLRFGLVNGEALSLKQVGARLGVSGERVRQVERQALELLRRHEKVCQEYVSR
jgi:RNA polymerase nonessential primary-like sigma factor